MAPLSLSAKASTSRLTRLSGLSHGMKPSKCTVLQPERLFRAVSGLVGRKSVALMKSEFDVMSTMVENC